MMRASHRSPLLGEALRAPASVTILIVEDKESLRLMLRKTLEAEGFAVETAEDGHAAMRSLRQKRHVMVLTDLRLPGPDGIQVLRTALDADPDVPVIVMTAFGTVETAVEAMKLGARDFLSKPIDTDHLLLLVRRAVEERALRRENMILRDALADRSGAPVIIGESEPLKVLARECQRVANTNATALLLGDSGTGKELFARAIHHLSPRRDHPFVALNCAAIPETLLENELFGHEKGAYTGATSAQIGKFELAIGGTLFLDEIGDLSPGVQAKLLRVLQEHAFERIGGTITIEVDVRIVAATNRDLQADVAAGRFREDLYYRLSVFPLHVPALSRRREDIPLLARHFLKKHGAALGRRDATLSDDALAALVAHSWPGNIRELENALERALILSDGTVITAQDLHLAAAPSAAKERLREIIDFSGALEDVVARASALVEELKIRDALQASDGNKTKAAQLLDVSYKTLLNKMRDLGLR
jgi:DNA-binding NtrC family response regulator